MRQASSLPAHMHIYYIVADNFACRCIAPSSAPENVSVSTVSSTSVQISWTPPPSANGIITEYRISVVEVDTASQQDHVTFTTSLIVQSLHPYYTYRFSVSAHTVETGPYSAVQVLQTPEDSKCTLLNYQSEFACKMQPSGLRLTIT